MEAGYVPLNDQPQSPPSQNIDANSVYLEVENPASGSEHTSEVAQVRNICTGILSCLFYVCSAPVLLLLLYVCVTVATVAALAICLTASVVFRLAQWPQSFTKWDVFGKVYKSKERAHSRCKYLANTLQSGKDGAKCLNRIISGLIIAVTIMTWLFLTGLATTAVIAVIASPLLAATFVFGDSAKGLFQGLIFVYVVHPFDVGDLCIIDEKMLEVKRIGIWCITFSKVRTFSKQQEIIYPNSELATKNAINYKTEFPWADKAELSLSSMEEQATKNLLQQIET